MNGRIKSLKYREERILKAQKDRNGYLCVHLYKNGKAKRKQVHRLIAEAFIPNPENKPEVNHLNGKEDNRTCSLEWATHLENIQHAYNTGLKKNNKIALQFDLQGNFIREWESITEATKQTNINMGHISECCRGKRSTAGGYIWRYKEEIK